MGNEGTWRWQSAWYESPPIREDFVIVFVDRLIEEHLAMKQNHNHVLWGLMNIAIWHRRFIMKDGVAG